MIKYILFIFLFFSLTLHGQVSIRAGMGINFQNTPSLNDYFDQNFSSSLDQVNDFNSVIIFSAEGGVMVSENQEVALELGYLINSYSYSYTLGRYELYYNSILPSLIYYYVISGEGYRLKFGGGGGLRFVHVEETLPGTASAAEYSSTGYGLLLKADGNTILGGNFYANIGVDVRYDLNGEPKSNGDFIINNASDERVNLNSLGFGIRLGIAYIF